MLDIERITPDQLGFAPDRVRYDRQSVSQRAATFDGELVPAWIADELRALQPDEGRLA